jgi:hypothetical protein
MTDWVVDCDIEMSENPMQAIEKHPKNAETNDIYFFNPMRQQQPRRKAGPPSNFAEKLSDDLEFALTEIFNYYSRSYTRPPKSFDDYHSQLYTIDMHQYMQFIKDMSIPVDKPAAIECYKRNAVNNQPLNYEQFKGSLTRLAVGANRNRVNVNLKKIAQLKEVLGYLQGGKKLPLHLCAFEEKD